MKETEMMMSAEISKKTDRGSKASAVFHTEESRKVLVSAAAGESLKNYLGNRGYEVTEFGPLKNVDKPVSCHPDMLYCSLKTGDESVVFRGDENLLTIKYPGDIRYNACSTGKYFIHNLKYTDPGLKAEAERLGLIPVNVSQGYAKCSIVVLDEDSIITYDRGIAEPCIKAGMNVLRVEPGHVRLEGYDTGFIGGTSGRIEDEIIFNGNLEEHPDYEKIKSFIEERGLKVKYFTEYELTDIGSIIPL